MKKKLSAGYTVEAAGVMAAVLFTIMIILRAAFSLQAEVSQMMKIHQVVEAERHADINKDKKRIERAAKGNGFSVTISAPVFRPEKSLRQWSIMEEKQ